MLLKEIYDSWLERTKHITEDCKHCGNKRYQFSHPMVTDRSRDDRPTINACPVCNFPDIGITQKCEYFALSKFPQVKSGEMTLDELLNPEGSEGIVLKKPIPEPVSKYKPLKLRPDAKHKKKPND